MTTTQKIAMISDIPTTDSRYRKFLAESDLDPDLLPGWHAAQAHEIRRLLRQHDGDAGAGAGTSDGAVIAWHDLNGAPLIDSGAPLVSVRLFAPGTGPKYLRPAGTSARLYIPTTFSATARKSVERGESFIVITEGEKKAESLCRRGIAAVAVAGVSMWGATSPGSTNVTLISDLRDVIDAAAELGIVDFVVLFDSDGRFTSEADPDAKKSAEIHNQKFVQNSDVYWNGYKLSIAIGKYRPGVAAINLYCPHAPGVPFGKQGADDWLRSAGGAAIQAIRDSLTGSQYEDRRRFADRELALVEARKTQGYIPLGKTHAGLVIWNRRFRQIYDLTPADLGSEAAIMNAVGGQYALASWPKYSKQGGKTVDMTLARVELFTACESAGFWSDMRERNGGVWFDKKFGGLLVNSVEGLWAAAPEGLRLLDDEARYGAADFVYTQAEKFRAPTSPPAQSDEEGAEIAAQLVGFYNKFSWTQPHDALLIAGWVAAQSICGALPARPGLSVTGEAGSGKSTCQAATTTLLGGDGCVLTVTNSGGSTANGFQQKMGKNSMPILLDEAEPGSTDPGAAKKRAFLMRQILDMMRSAFSSADDGAVVGAVKGTADGRGREYSSKLSVFFTGITRPNLEQADRNRLLLLEIKKLQHSERLDLSTLPALSARIRATMICRFDAFRRIFNWLQATATVEARLAQAWGTPLAAITTLLSPNILDSDEGRENLRTTFDAICQEQMSADGNDASEADGVKVLRAIFSKIVEIDVPWRDIDPEDGGGADKTGTARRRLSIAEIFSQAEKLSERANDNFAQKELKRLGIARIDGPAGFPRIAISGMPSVKRLLEGSDHEGQSVTGSLRRLPGAETARLNFPAGKTSCVVVSTEMLTE